MHAIQNQSNIIYACFCVYKLIRVTMYNVNWLQCVVILLTTVRKYVFWWSVQSINIISIKINLLSAQRFILYINWPSVCIGETPIYMYTCTDLILHEKFKIQFKLDNKDRWYYT